MSVEDDLKKLHEEVTCVNWPNDNTGAVKSTKKKMSGRFYAIYKHKSKGYIIKKFSFLWLSFFSQLFALGWFWAFINRLWKVGILLIFIDFMLYAMIKDITMNENQWSILASLYVLFSIYVGVQSKKWIEKSLQKRSYIRMGAETAPNKETALSVFLE